MEGTKSCSNVNGLCECKNGYAYVDADCKTCDTGYAMENGYCKGQFFKADPKVKKDD